MQIVRTIVWVLLLVALLLFSINNWQDVEVKIWENLILQTKLPALVIAAFLLGLLPMWLLNKGNRWRFNRRINALENTVKAAAVSAPVAAPEPSATDTPNLTP
jgi:putative membrane protein